MNKPVLYISIGALIAFLLSAIIVSSLNLVTKSTNISGNNDSNKNMFMNQSAVFEGTISNRQDNIVTLLTKDNMSEDFSLGQSLQITKFNTGSTLPTVTTNVADIELNKPVSVVLNMTNNTFEVVNITYMPERVEPINPPPTIKTSSSSATPR
jgi:hypothetical protein